MRPPRAPSTRPRPTCRHFENADSTSRAVAAAVAARLEALPAWAAAEHAAAKARSAPGELPGVWASRQAELITFLLHQLRDSRAEKPAAEAAWQALRQALAPYANPAPGLDFLRVAGQNKKKAAALALYALRLTGLYRYLPNQEERSLQ